MDITMQDRSWTEINLDNFAHNLKELKSFLPENTSFMQIVKADAYGHGAYEIALVAIREGTSFLGVANAEEGALLRYQGISIPILVLSPSLVTEIPIILDNNLVCTISDLAFADALHVAALSAGKVATVHIKLDTGMHRNGFPIEETERVFDILSGLKGLFIDGIYSHFAASESDPEFTIQQVQLFVNSLKELPRRPEHIHISNSTAALTLHIPYTNMVRFGLLSYGIYSNAEYETRVELKPVMTFKTKISLLKNLVPGDSVGYNRTYIAESQMKIAILPVGYADGYDFMLSNRSSVQISLQSCKVIGKISMDMIAIDVSNINDVHVGQEVVLLGSERNELRVEHLVSLYEGNAYELLCQVGRRAKRYYYENGNLISSSPLLRRDFVSHDFSDQKLSTIIESALSQRLQSKELSNLIVHDILKMFFFNKDKDIHYRQHFEHEITFSYSDDKKLSDYFLTETKLTYKKVLENDYFIVACANNSKTLDKYFRRLDVEYRWLLDEKFSLNEDKFTVTSVKVNDVDLEVSNQLNEGCLEIHCTHPQLINLINEEVKFSISTRTYYSRKSHQMSVFINDLTQGVSVRFCYPSSLDVEAVPIFAGQNKFPKIDIENNAIRVYSNKDEWIFPQSGIVFTY
jgi:alanine racemase